MHIHYVVQPVTRAQMDRYGAHGPMLQVAMFDRGHHEDRSDVERVSERARQRFATR